jgi:phage terminase large subunit
MKNKEQKEHKKTDIEIFREMQLSPLLFIQLIRWLVPERDNTKRMKWKNISRQQHDILLWVEKAMRWEDKRRLSIASWHWIWKSTTLAWLVLRYLFCYKDSQIPVTAPTADQMYDVLRKEISKRLRKMPVEIQEKFERTTSYIRVTESPETRFARAKTARKENPEALAWIHAEHVLMLVDEASWVDDVIYNVWEWALTDSNTLVILISNPTRLIWYFYDTHHKDSKNRQTFQFSWLDSPLVDYEYVERIRDRSWWEDTDEYRIRVLWQFPKEDLVDEKWYVPLLLHSDMHTTFESDITPFVLWIDPAWEWKDETIRVARDEFRAKVVLREKTSTDKTIAMKTLQLLQYYKIKGENVFVDSFWVWSNIYWELMKAWISIQPLNVWMKAQDEERFLNLRAELHRRMRERLKRWWELVNDRWRQDLMMLRYRQEINWKLKIMSKQDMRKMYGKSPDTSDALMLTFLIESRGNQFEEYVEQQWIWWANDWQVIESNWM